MKFEFSLTKSIVLLLGFFFLIGTTLFHACVKNKASFGPPQNLRCESQTNPLGIDGVPRLSWQVNDQRRGAVQTACQLLVASSPELLAQNQGDIWDTGKIDSDQSIHVPYAGPALKSQQRYYWKVCTWDADGKSSGFSEPAWWEMGLLNPEDWQAQWIGLPEERPKAPEWPWNCWIWHPTEIGVDVPIFLRHQFEIPLKKSISSATLKAVVDNKFVIFLNGTEIGAGDKLQSVYQFDVQPNLKSGSNLFAIKATNTAGDICGFILSLKITFDDSSTLVINTEPGWKSFDTEVAGWNQPDFNDNAWVPAIKKEDWGGRYWGKADTQYTPPRSTLLRHEFSIKQPITRARAYVTGLGSYVLYLNGQRVGDDVFTPGWTDYPTRIQYQTYDVTQMLRDDQNAVGAMLGNIWYSSGLGWPPNNVYSEGPLRLLLQLVITYRDGSQEVIATNADWQADFSPLLENSLYHGETWDARLEQDGWNQADLDAAEWQSVAVLPPETGRLVAQQAPKLQVTQELEPVSVNEIEPGKFIFDLGQNMVGWVRLKVEGEAGTRVQLRFGEELQPNGQLYTANLRRAKATDVYILKGDGTEIWEPNFTYHGFRYVEITGFPGTPTKGTIRGRLMHSNAPVIGKFECSKEILNQIQHNITWGLRGNLHSVPTDCPQRDERLGWMGDAQIFAPTASYNRNMGRFFSKWMHDIVDCQDPDGAVHDVNPAIVVGGPAKPAWGDAVIVIPWVVYQFTGDTRVIAKNYDGMAAWVNYMKNNSKDGIYAVEGYGDWVAVVPSPKLPLSAAYYYYDHVLMSQMAEIIGKTDDAQAYAAEAAKIAERFHQRYWDSDAQNYEGATQTANLLPLAFGLVPDDLVPKVVENVVTDVKQRDTHLSTGFIGTAYLLPMLSQYGYHDLAYQLAVQTTYPSWGYMVSKGATTIWELWNSDTAGPGMNSRNHFALGSVGEWFFSWLGGLRPEAAHPGFKQTLIAPRPVGDLTWVDASVKTGYGLLRSHWKKDGDKLKLNVTIPANTSALVSCPVTGENPVISEGGKTLFDGENSAEDVAGISFKSREKDAVVFHVSAGTYEFVVE